MYVYLMCCFKTILANTISPELSSSLVAAWRRRRVAPRDRLRTPSKNAVDGREMGYWIVISYAQSIKSAQTMSGAPDTRALSFANGIKLVCPFFRLSFFAGQRGFRSSPRTRTLAQKRTKTRARKTLWRRPGDRRRNDR